MKVEIKSLPAMPVAFVRHVGPCHEIYLSDPRRITPGRPKTLLRWPVRTKPQQQD